MTELAVHLSNPGAFQWWERFLESRELADIQLPPSPVELEAKSWKTLRNRLQQNGNSRADRLYLGNEYCPHLAWSERELRKGLERADAAGMAATIVLGVQREHELEATLRIVEKLAGQRGEVVANDWGTLSLLRSTGAVPVAGRFLFKMKRLPRLTRETKPVSDSRLLSPEDERRLLEHQLEELKLFPGDSPWQTDFFKQLGVARVDTEILPQGIIFDPAGGLAVSLHTPWTYVTGGGPCPVESLFTRQGITHCARRCRTTAITPRYPTRTWPILQAGHTLFSAMTSVLNAHLSNPRYDRLILEPALPM